MMVVIGWVVRIIIVLFILRMVFRLLGIGQPPASRNPRMARKRHSPGEIVGGTLVRDPQCGTYIPQTGALELTAGRATQYFCSPKCRDAWAAAQAH